MGKLPLGIDVVQVFFIDVEDNVAAIEDEIDFRLLRLDVVQAGSVMRRSVPFIFQVYIGEVCHPQNGGGEVPVGGVVVREMGVTEWKVQWEGGHDQCAGQGFNDRPSLHRQKKRIIFDPLKQLRLY